jgi:hypothetical protein
MEAIFCDPSFENLITGKTEEKYSYFFKNKNSIQHGYNLNLM